jgi:PIN domain nuclease of toxin-antitoxin system
MDTVTIRTPKTTLSQLLARVARPQRDPLDRILIPRAMADNLVLVSNEQPFDTYGAAPLW